MEFDEYQRQSGETDRLPDGLEGLRLALLGVAGEAGSAASEAKKSFRDGQPSSWLRKHVAEELGDVLWYVAAVARRIGLNLDEIVASNLAKNAELWRQDLPDAPDYDSGYPARQRLPRRFSVRFEEDAAGPVPLVRMRPLGDLKGRIEEHRRDRGLPPLEQVGDDLDDNAAVDDGYRYHDVIHMAHAAVLGWSPVLRTLIGAKRKDDKATDRIQDGARAIAIEEGLSAFVFSYAEERNFLLDTGVGWELIKHARRTTQSLEVHDQPPVAWTSTYEQAFGVFQELREQRGGVVEADLDARRLQLAANSGNSLQK